MKPINTLPPFKRLCVTIGNLPSSYVDSMSYYECLLWLINYLQKTVIPAINENAEAVKEIQDWIENLDLQDEVDNKLDEMAESGELQEIISEYLNSKAIFGFDTVADMKSATNLINGSYAKTLNYYGTDKGGATYKIRTITNDDVVDEMFIIELDDNTLVAELQLEDGIIYANKLGIDNTGTTDSSTKLNKALEKINDLWLSGSKINTLVLNGIYKVDNQIEIPPCAKLRSNGLVKIISSVVNDSTLFIHYLDTNLPTTDTDKQRYLSGELINFASGSILVHSGDRTTSNSIGVEIGDRSNLGSDYCICKYMIRNLTITNFSTGILHNSYHVYLGNYENVLMELNTTNVKFGLSSQISTATDSGERMTFSNCLFGPCTYGVYFDSINWTVFFDNCSFDFDVNVFYQPSNSQYWNRVNVINSHFEGFTSLINGLTGNEEFVNINNSIVFNSYLSNEVFKNTTTKITIRNSEFYASNPNKLMNADKFVLFGNKTYQKNTKPLQVTMSNQFTYSDNLLNNFDSLADGDINATPGYSVGEFKVLDRSGIGSSSIVTDNELYTGHKSLVLVKSSTVSSIQLETDYIPLKGEEVIMSGILTKNIKNRQMRALIEFYDINKNSIKYKTSFEWYPASIPADTWVINPLTNFDEVPANACYYKIRAILPSMGESDPISTKYYIGGIISNSR